MVPPQPARSSLAGAASSVELYNALGGPRGGHVFRLVRFARAMPPLCHFAAFVRSSRPAQRWAGDSRRDERAVA